MKRIIALMVIVVLAAGVWFWRSRAGSETAQPTQPTTTTISLAPHRVTVAGPGSLEAARTLAVTSEVGGAVVEIVDIGTRVEAGEVIARLDPAPFERTVRDAEFALEKAQAQLAGLVANQSDSTANQRQNIAEAQDRVNSARREEQRLRAELTLAQDLLALGTESPATVQTAQDSYDAAAADLAAAEASLTRLQDSFELQGTSSSNDRRNSELAVAQAELTLEDAQADLDAITVEAAFAGVVSELTTSQGASVSSQGVLLTLISDTTLSLPVQIDETQIARVALGQAADVTLDAIPGETFPGTVTAIAPVAQIESNIPIFYVTVTVENQELRLRPGMTAEAEIVVDSYDATATVPLAALRPLTGAPADMPTPMGEAGADADNLILVREADGTFAPRPVKLVDSVGFNAIVTGNVAGGDVVLVSAEGTGQAAGFSGAAGPGGGFPGGGPGGGFPGGGGPPPGAFR